MSPWRFLRIVVASISLLCMGCAAASKPSPPATPTPVQPTVQVGDTTVVALSAPAAACCPHQTLPQFLGLDKLFGGVVHLFRGLGARLSSRLDLAGRFPAIQDPPPPLLSITDPANLSADAPPAVKAAAEIKAEEDAAAQKIQAVRYLASIGCGGCYPSVEVALLAALDDCTEAVRYEAVVALRGKDISCRYCSSESCCSEKVRAKLQKIAYETNDQGCLIEPSDRIRREARLALAACGGGAVTVEAPEEGPEAPHEGGEETAQRVSLLSTLQLASFKEPIAAAAANSLVLARVNGEPISESRVVELVHTKRDAQGLNQSPAEGERAYDEQFKRQLGRLVEATLLQQAARESLGLAEKPTADQISQWLEQAVAVNENVRRAEIAAVYLRDQKKYAFPAKVRWERVSVPLAAYKTREKSHAVIAFLRQRAMGAEAKTPPGFDPANVETQTHPWSTRKQISSQIIADILFRLPIGQLSPIIQDQRAFHLVRVLERSAAGAKPLEAVESKIRRELMEQRRAAAARALLAKLRRRATIWTVFDSSPQSAPLRELQGSAVLPAAWMQPLAKPPNRLATTEPADLRRLPPP